MQMRDLSNVLMHITVMEFQILNCLVLNRQSAQAAQRRVCAANCVPYYTHENSRLEVRQEIKFEMVNNVRESFLDFFDFSLSP